MRIKAIALCAVTAALLCATPLLAQDKLGDATAGGQADGKNGFGPLPKSDPAAAVGPPANDPAANPELEDFGVPPQATLFGDAPHAPTPTTIPGGQVITTAGVQGLIDGQAGPFLMLDILGGQTGLPDAIRAVPAAQGGTFDDQTQGQFGQFLEQATQGKKDMPIVTYCLSPHCWMSYNAALRAINLGYTNVLWYRGGVEAWQANGKQMVPLQ